MGTKVVLEHITKVMRKQAVLDDVSLTIKAGQVVGLSGINGSGKTMLMRAIAGLIRPNAGQIWVDDKQLWRDCTFPSSLGLLLENPAFLDAYSGYENLRILASIKGLIDESEIRHILELVGLTSAGKKTYRRYSLGMRQRLGIAAAVMEKPELVLLDEPTNSLDADGVQMLKEVLVLQRERKATVILSCHDQTILEALSDIIYPITNGKLGSPIHQAGGTAS